MTDRDDRDREKERRSWGEIEAQSSNQLPTNSHI